MGVQLSVFARIGNKMMQSDNTTYYNRVNTRRANDKLIHIGLYNFKI